MSIVDSNNINVSNNQFLNAYNSVLRIYNSFNVTIDRSHFNKNSYQINVLHDGILELRSCKNFSVTRSNFTNNVIAPIHSAVINIERSMGLISCCNFTNNSLLKAFGGVVKLWFESLVFVTNSTFSRNNFNFSEWEGSAINLFSSSTSATVISSVFRFNTFGRSGGALSVHRDSNATVLASEFSHNRAGRYGHSIMTHSNRNSIVIGCNHFHNNSNTDGTDLLDSNVQVLRNNTIGCSRYAIGEDGVCTNLNCEGM